MGLGLRNRTGHRRRARLPLHSSAAEIAPESRGFRRGYGGSTSVPSAEATTSRSFTPTSTPTARLR